MFIIQGDFDNRAGMLGLMFDSDDSTLFGAQVKPAYRSVYGVACQNSCRTLVIDRQSYCYD